MNLTEAKYNMQKYQNKLLNIVNKSKSSQLFVSDYETDYAAKKKAEKEQIHKEIKRIYEVS